LESKNAGKQKTGKDMFTFYFATNHRKSSAGEKQAGLVQMVSWVEEYRSKIIKAD